MPWVRIDENAMDHPKIGGLPDGAFRLWVQALAYCQKFLTDGLVNAVALKGLRAYSPKRRSILVSVGLWDESENGAIAVHDFLQWNESRETVLQAREDARLRRRRYRDRHASPDADSTANVPSGVVCSERTGDILSEEGPGETKDPVQRFVDRWRQLHQQYRGVAYLGNPGKDYTAACELVDAFGVDFAEAIAVYGLNDPDPFMRKSTVTITMLKSRASKYAEELKAKRLA